MTNEQWDALVRRLESQARENPRGYGRKVVLLGALGYVFLAASLLALAALGALVVVLAIKGPGILLKLLLPIGALAWVIVRSIPVRFEAPRGASIRRQDAPELFGMLDDVKKRVRGPKLHAVLVDDELNASVVQIPRLAGLLGQRNILVLGLPYMQALSADELRAVVGQSSDTCRRTTVGSQRGSTASA